MTQLWISLGLSIPLVVFASTILSSLMDRFPIILILGAALLGKVGGEMIITDPGLDNWFHWAESRPIRWAFQALTIAGVLFVAWQVHRRETAAGAEGAEAAEGEGGKATIGGPEPESPDASGTEGRGGPRGESGSKPGAAPGP